MSSVQDLPYHCCSRCHGEFNYITPVYGGSGVLVPCAFLIYLSLNKQNTCRLIAQLKKRLTILR